MMARIGRTAMILSLLLILAAFAACRSGASVQPAKRTIYIAAVEPKGSATVDKEPFPTTALPAGGGYALKAPDKDGKWEVETYRWEPGTVIVNQDDEVTLEIIGINGKEHPTTIEGYNVNFKVLRGQVARVTFKADKAGIFAIRCSAHEPSMNAQLVVLPRS